MSAQSFTDHLTHKVEGQGTVTVHQDSLIMAIDSSATRTDVAEIFGFTRLIFENKGEKHGKKE